MTMVVEINMRNAIDRKRTLVNELNDKLDAITILELDLETRERNLMNNTDWNELFKTTKKVTDKQKVAHIESILKKEQDKVVILKNDVRKIKNNIGLCDDEISLCKYSIRETEMNFTRLRVLKGD